jgi:hypothetical protein
MTRYAPTILLLAHFALCGCKSESGASVSGKVTFNGQDLEKGYITFFPAEGADSMRGAEVVNGEFKVVDLKPGKKRVVVSSTPEPKVRETKKGEVLQFPRNQIRITPQTAGNNVVMDVNAGATVMNLDLGKR